MLFGLFCMCIKQYFAPYLLASLARLRFLKLVISLMSLKPLFKAYSRQYSSKLSKLKIACS